jgi:hypothetical protein
MLNAVKAFPIIPLKSRNDTLSTIPFLNKSLRLELKPAFRGDRPQEANEQEGVRISFEGFQRLQPVAAVTQGFEPGLRNRQKAFI